MRKGTRRKKLEIAQLWQCKLCRRVFTPAPPQLRYKTFPLRVILDGVTLYNLGYALPDAAKRLKVKHGYKVSPSTLASWMDEHRELTTYRRLRERPHDGLSPAQTIRSIKRITAKSTALRIIGRSSPWCAIVHSIGASRH